MERRKKDRDLERRKQDRKKRAAGRQIERSAKKEK